MLASAVSAPIFFAVANTRLPNFSFSSDWMFQKYELYYGYPMQSFSAMIGVNINF